MGNIANEILSKEHDGSNETKGKRGFLYGWDYNNLEPVKLAVDENGYLLVTGLAEEIAFNDLSDMPNGDIAVGQVSADGAFLNTQTADNTTFQILGAYNSATHGIFHRKYDFGGRTRFYMYFRTDGNEFIELRDNQGLLDTFIKTDLDVDGDLTFNGSTTIYGGPAPAGDLTLRGTSSGLTDGSVIVSNSDLEVPDGYVGLGTTTPDGKLHVEGNAYIGDKEGNGDYTEIKADGEINLHGTARVYDGREIKATEFKEPASQNATITNRGMGAAMVYSDGNEKHIHTQLRIPDKWVDTEDVNVILIWESPATSQDCDWEVKYLFRAADEDMMETTPDGTIQSYETSSATANGLVHSVLTIPTADFDSGDKNLTLEIWRDGNDGSDTLGDTAYLHAIMVRGVANQLGGAI